MKLSHLASRRQTAISNIASKLDVKLAGKGKPEIRELFNLEAIEDAIAIGKTSDGNVKISEVLSIPDLSKGSIAKIKAYYGDSS